MGVGETFVRCNVVSLLKAKETLGENTEVTLDDLATEVRGISAMRAKTLRQHGCTIIRAHQLAWDVMWRMFKRDGEHHPGDHTNQLGDQGETNF